MKGSSVDVAKVYRGIRSVMLEQYRTVYGRAQAQHDSTRGALYERLVQDFLSEHLPQRFYIGDGQVLSSISSRDVNGSFYSLSRQIDVVIFDAFNHPILLPKYELFPIEGTLAVVEVKSKLNKRTLLGTKDEVGALENIASAKCLVSEEAMDINWRAAQGDAPTPCPLGVIFAFESNKPRSILNYWKKWNDARDARYSFHGWTDMICLLDKGALLVDTNRIGALLDRHQISPGDILRAHEMQLVALTTPDVLFLFFNLLLRQLRNMTSLTQRLSETTPSTYLEAISFTDVAHVDNPASASAEELLSKWAEGTSNGRQITFHK